MKKTTKVTLLSLLVFPGAGHFVLKKHLIGIAFFTSFSYLFLGLIKDIYDKTQHVVDSIVQGKIYMDAAAIKQALIDHRVFEGSNMSTISYILLFIWIIAAYDAYRIAKNSNADIT